MMRPIPQLDQQELIDSLRGANEVLAGQAGLIDVDAARTASGIPYVYSLMKIPGEHRGIHYNLTLHLVGDQTLQIRNLADGRDNRC